MKSNAKNKQFGGTLLGIIIGLVVGLTIAVVVALMITKTSTPFTNKLGITKSDAPVVQLTDPNKPLYGNSAKEIMANSNKPSDTASPAADTVVLPSQPAAVPAPEATKSDTKVEVKPDSKADTKNAKPAETVAKKGEADEKAASYYLQVGAFRDSGDAESARAKLALIGVESRVLSSEGDSLYRVRIGPFDQIDSMNRMRSKLSENSIDVAVIKTPK